ncbi:MAG: hypothetical protein JW841_05790 [Deltaproteobacteria bacterium]|nr:hypothetical protein [Deltaproteobacteria bacterium]
MKAKQFFKQTILLGAALIFASHPLYAQEKVQNKKEVKVQTQTQTQATYRNLAYIAADELQKNGALNAEQVEPFKMQLQKRLYQQNSEALESLCTQSDNEKCQLRLRQQLRECDKEGRQQGSIKSPQEAARVAASLMVATAKGSDIDETGQMIKSQLKNKWSVKNVEDTANEIKQMQKQHRWLKQARQMLNECVNENSCNPTQARIALSVMKQASNRADLDARQAHQEIRLVLREQQQQKTQLKETPDSENALKTKMQKRLRLRAQNNNTTVSSENGLQQRHRYRNGMNGEIRQGGGFGGKQSGGAGAGFGGGSGSGNGNGAGSGGSSSGGSSSGGSGNSSNTNNSNSSSGSANGSNQ